MKLNFFQLAILGVFGVCAVAGLAVFALAVGNGGGADVGPVVIWGTFDKDAFNSVINNLSNTNQAFGQVSYVQKDADTYMSDITQALATGNGPDLIILPDDDAYAAEQLVSLIPDTEISSATFTGTFIDGAAPFLAPGGIIGIPIVADPLVLYWNHDLMNSAGFADAPLFWDEVYDMSKSVTKRQADGSISVATIPFGVFDNYDNAKAVLTMLIEQAGGGITSRAQDGSLQSALAPTNSSEQGSDAESALRFFTGFADPSQDIYSWNAAQQNALASFAAGTLALYVGYESEGPQIVAKNPNLNFSATSTPQIRNSKSILDGGRVYALAIPHNAKNPTGAKTIAYALASTNGSTQLAQALGLTSARRNVLQSDHSLGSRMAGIMRTWVDPDPTKTDSIFRDMIDNVTSGIVLWPEAVQRADLQLQNLLHS